LAVVEREVLEERQHPEPPVEEVLDHLAVRVAGL
jgi:hypothetical protein